ncbi:MAG: hypothetical protein LAO30_20815 [Acidobacteriia bacterium]|nr:hypothetical protein [Terriglobia bacterium]
MGTWRIFTICMYLGFVAAVSWACFCHPVADDFDRYIYEALVRGKYETPEVVYPIIKHSNKRAEESSILDSPTHLGQLEPLYAIKPLYVKAIEATAFTGLPIQSRINLISALSLFGAGIIVLAWTAKPGYSALLMAVSAIVRIFRVGTPDGLSTLVVLAGLWAISRSKLLPGVLLLLVSVWIRTDNILLVITILGYLIWQKRMTLVDAGVLSALAVGSVVFISHFSGNYGWRVLFQFSFIGGRAPAEIDPHFGVAEYLAVATGSAETIIPQVAIWALLGIVAWKWYSPSRGLLMPVWVAVAAHFLLYPSPESRYLVWAFLVTGVIFVSALQPVQGPKACDTEIHGAA